MSSKALVSFMIVTGLGAVTATAQAQDGPRIHWHVMGGYSEPVGATRDYLQGGYLVSGGFSVSPSNASPLDLRVDVSYSEHNASNYLIDLGQQATNAQIDNGTGSFWSATANVVYKVPIIYGVKGYGIAGIGVYHERVELTQYDPNSGYYACDPFLGYCDGIPADALVASSGVTKFGWNAGAGVEFALPYNQAWFVEARFHRISTNRPIEFVPITIGYKF